MIRSVLIGVGVLVVLLMRSLADGFGLADESWFLQVVQRLRDGDVLYRDVAYSATPLAVYLTTALSYPVGLEIIAVKIVTNAAFALTAVVADRLVRRMGVSPVGSWVLMGVLIVWARPYGNPPYTPVAMAMFVATLAATLVAVGRDGQEGREGEEGRHRLQQLRYVWVGGLAGLSFAAKQNIGGLALAAALAAVTLVASDRRRTARLGALVTAGFAAATSLVLAPVLASGGLPGLWEYGVAGKGIYVRRGGISYLASLGGWIRDGRDLPAPEAVLGVAHGLVLVLPVAVGLVAAWRWRRLDTGNRVLIVFAAAALATAFPRWDRFHMAYAIPVHLLALVSMLRLTAAESARSGSNRWIPRLAAAALLGLAVGGPMTAAAGVGGRRPSTLPHFRGPLVAADTERRLAAGAGALADASGGQPMFVLSTNAGFWYVASGVRNPTPFDIPAVTSVGRSGVALLLAQLSSRAPMQVCVDNRPPTPLELAEVVMFVRGHLQKGPDVGPCTVYRPRDTIERQTGGTP